MWHFNDDLQKLNLRRLHEFHLRIVEGDELTPKQADIAWLILCSIRLNGEYIASLKHVAESVGVTLQTVAIGTKRIRQGRFIGGELVRDNHDGKPYGRNYYIKVKPYLEISSK